MTRDEFLARQQAGVPARVVVIRDNTLTRHAVGGIYIDAAACSNITVSGNTISAR